MTVVIVREDFLNDQPMLSSMLDYRIQAENDSLYNTPPAYSIYISKLVFEWVKEIGGVDEMEKINRENLVCFMTISTSLISIQTLFVKRRAFSSEHSFVSPSEELDAKFVKEATAAGFKNIKGHRSVGGMRASLYNAFPRQGVVELIEFMKNLQRRMLNGN